MTGGVAVLTAAAVLVASCGLLKPTEASFEFSFVPVGGDNEINQVLIIKNTGDTAAAPTLRYTALDRSGAPIPAAIVRTAYGSDAGHLVAPHGEVLDVLAFDGVSPDDVADVRVKVENRKNVPALNSAFEEITVQALDASGTPVDKHEVFAAVRLRNANKDRVTARVAYLLYTSPPAGGRQQAFATVQVTGVVTIEPESEKTVPISSDARVANARYAGGKVPVSLKAYLSPS